MNFSEHEFIYELIQVGGGLRAPSFNTQNMFLHGGRGAEATVLLWFPVL